MGNKVSLTDAVCNRALCPAGRDRVYVFDAKTAGLALCVTNTGTKTFYVCRRVFGRPQRIRIGEYPAWTVGQARIKASEINRDIDSGHDPLENKRAVKGEMTFGELFAYYIEQAKPRKRSWRGDQEQYDLHLRKWSGRKLSAIRQADVAALHAALGQQKKTTTESTVHTVSGPKQVKRSTKYGGPYAANRVLALLHTLFATARQTGFKGDNPAAGIKRYPEYQRDRFLHADELPKFFAELKKSSNAFRDFTTMCLLTGARKANVLAMKWLEVNIERGTWRIQSTKTGEAVTVPLCPEAIDILRSRQKLARGQWVFPSTRSVSGHYVEPQNAWRGLLKRAGIADLRLHDLRRTLGSWQAATGASLPVIGKTLGHKHQSTTTIYARLDIDPVRQAVNRATEAMFRAGEEKQA